MKAFHKREKHLKATPSERANARAYHCLPYHWRHLTEIDHAEIRDVLDEREAGLNARLSDQRLAWKGSLDERGLRLRRDWETLFAIETILATGWRLADIHSLKIFPDSGSLASSPRSAGFLAVEDEVPTLVVPPISVTLKADEDETVAEIDEAPREKIKDTRLSETKGAPQEASNRKIGWASRRLEPTMFDDADRRRLEMNLGVRCANLMRLRYTAPQGGIPIFTTPIITLCQEIERVLSERREDETAQPRRATRTLESLERDRLARLLKMPGGDPVYATRITGRYHSSNAGHYYGRTLFRGRDAQGRPTDVDVGGDVEFATGDIRHIIERLKSDFRRQPNFENLSRYTVFVVAFGIAHRPHGRSLPGSLAIDNDTGFCVLNDKEKQKDAQARIVWVPDIIRAQILAYEQAIDRLAEPTDGTLWQSLRWHVEKGELRFPLPVRPNGNLSLKSALWEAIEHCAPKSSVPENCGRHWLRTHLTGRCSSETVEAFFGHWNAGFDPWAHGSCLDPLAFRADLERTLPALLDDLGVEVLRIGEQSPQARRSRLVLSPESSSLKDRTATFRTSFSRVSVAKADLPSHAEIHDAILRKSWGTKHPQGRVLASAIFNGALLDKSLWDGWIKSVRSATYCDELQWVSVRMRSAWSSVSTSRWIADPVTRMIIRSSFNRLAEAAVTDASSALGDFLREVLGREISPDEFLSIAECYWSFRLPSLLFDQAIGAVPCTTLSDYGWRRLIDARRGDKLKPTLLRNRFFPAKQSKQKQLDSFRLRPTFSRESEIFELLNDLVRRGEISRNRAPKLCAELLTYRLQKGARDRRALSLSGGHQTLLRWCIYCLTERRSLGGLKGHSPVTVEERLAILVELVFKNDVESEAFDIDLESLRQPLALTETHVASLIEPAKRLLEEFLEWEAEKRTKKKEKPALTSSSDDSDSDPDAEDDDYTRPTAWVSAHVLCEKSFGRLREILATGKEGRANRDGLELALIATLGYRAGLRLAEILGLRLGDIVRRDHLVELHVEHTGQRRLKTFWSRRILPLHELMHADELEALETWLEDRKTLRTAILNSPEVFRQDRARKPPKNGSAADHVESEATEKLFGPPFSRSIIDISVIKKDFEHAFKGVEGYDKGDFRWLRHSFGSLLMLKMMLPAENAVGLLPPSLSASVQWDEGKRLRDILVGSERLGRSVLHAVSQAMGHTGIGQTLNSYQHLLDLILCMYVSRHHPDEKEMVDKVPTMRRSRHGSRDWPASRADHAPDFLTAYRKPAFEPLSFSDGWWFHRRTAQEAQTPGPSDGATQYSFPLEEDCVRSILPWPALLVAMNQDVSAFGVRRHPPMPFATETRWQTDAERIAKKYLHKSKTDSRITVPHGARAQFELNRLWSNLPSEISDGEKKAIGQFIGNFAVKNGYSQVHDTKVAETLKQFLIKCGIRASHIQINSVARFNAIRGKKSGQNPHLSGKIDPNHSGYAQVSFHPGQYWESPLGKTADVSRRKSRPKADPRHRDKVASGQQRFLAESWDVRREKRKEDRLKGPYQPLDFTPVRNLHPAVSANYRHLTYAYKLFILMVAVKEGIVEEKLVHASKVGKITRGTSGKSGEELTRLYSEARPASRWGPPRPRWKKPTTS